MARPYRRDPLRTVPAFRKQLEIVKIRKKDGMAERDREDQEGEKSEFLRDEPVRKYPVAPGVRGGRARNSFQHSLQHETGRFLVHQSLATKASPYWN